ncbi:MAG: hypothetical protein KOO65_08660 [Desulfobacterales bacterium]|nr:hypothetical protein [Desulfobacterales bacterium]
MNTEKLYLKIDKIERLPLEQGKYAVDVYKNKWGLVYSIEYMDVFYTLSDIYFRDAVIGTYDGEYHSTVLKEIVELCQQYVTDVRATERQKEGIQNVINKSTLALKTLALKTSVTLALH